MSNVMVPKILLLHVLSIIAKFIISPSLEGVICRLFDIGLKEEALHLEMRRETSRFVVIGTVMSTQVRCSVIYER